MGDERGTRGRPRRFVVFETRVPTAAGARRCGGAYKLHFTAIRGQKRGSFRPWIASTKSQNVIPPRQSPNIYLHFCLL